MGVGELDGHVTDVGDEAVSAGGESQRRQTREEGRRREKGRRDARHEELVLDQSTAHENTVNLVPALVHEVDDLTSLEGDGLSRGVVAESKVADGLVELHTDEHPAHLVVGERRAVTCGEGTLAVVQSRERRLQK